MIDRALRWVERLRMMTAEVEVSQVLWWSGCESICDHSRHRPCYYNNFRNPILSRYHFYSTVLHLSSSEVRDIIHTVCLYTGECGTNSELRRMICRQGLGFG